MVNRISETDREVEDARYELITKFLDGCNKNPTGHITILQADYFDFLRTISESLQKISEDRGIYQAMTKEYDVHRLTNPDEAGKIVAQAGALIKREEGDIQDLKDEFDMFSLKYKFSEESVDKYCQKLMEQVTDADITAPDQSDLKHLVQGPIQFLKDLNGKGCDVAAKLVATKFLDHVAKKNGTGSACPDLFSENQGEKKLTPLAEKLFGIEQKGKEFGLKEDSLFKKDKDAGGAIEGLLDTINRQGNVTGYAGFAAKKMDTIIHGELRKPSPSPNDPHVTKLQKEQGISKL